MYNKLITIFTKIIATIKVKNVQALLLLDFILLPLALFTSVLLRLGGNWDHRLNHDVWIFIALPLWTIPIFIHFGLYKAVIRYLDDKVVSIVFIGVTLSVVILIACLYFWHINAFPKTSVIIFWVFALAYIGGTRFVLRGVMRKLVNHNKINVAIYGAGSAGIQICTALQQGNEYNPVALFDDDPLKWNTMIRGIKIHNPAKLSSIVKLNGIKQILLAMPSINNYRRQLIIKQLELLSLNIKTLPSMADLISGNITINDIKEIDIEDLLERKLVECDTQLIKHNIENKIVLVTGAGGSIGSELIRQIAKIGPKLIILMDISEFSLYSIDQELSQHYSHINKVMVLGSVTNLELMESIFQNHSINTIYHAAAYKHVPIVEANQISAIHNNVIGTYNITQLANKYKVDCMILISTDKAVRPTNVMGATKRLSEIILQAYNSISLHTKFTMVRFGNVLGSSGSVVPLFRKQIKAGGPLTVTHPEVTRYFMTITEAVQLVIQAGNMVSGGEVFVLDMGVPVKIYHLAKKMIHLSGYSIKEDSNPNGDIEIIFTGLRNGEKLYEELLIGNNPQPTQHPLIMKSNEKFIDYQQLHDKISDLRAALKINDTKLTTALLKELVIEYNPQSK
jgi:FlaA1/EpsC-like NDP-sugar epimerase